VAADRAAAAGPSLTVLAFGTPVYEPEAYHRYAGPGIELAAEPGAARHVVSATGLLARSYNLILDAAAGAPDLEGVVLVHPHAQITDRDFAAKVRAALADPEVAVVGAAGAVGVRGLAWWEAEVHAGAGLRIRYQEHGGGEVRAFGWADPGPVPAEVDAADGSLLALSPWAARNLRFDEGLWLGHGFDVDLCFQARAAGRRVVVADLGAILHRPLDVLANPEAWGAAHRELAEKWDAGEADEPAWRARALRAEADREAARIMAYFAEVEARAVLEPVQARLDAVEATVGWRATAPLRQLNAWRRGRRSS
jgi:hypothetical protein